jgi:hypothetical protein
MVQKIKNAKETLLRWRAKTVRKDSLGASLISRDVGSDLATHISREQREDPSYYVKDRNGHLIWPYFPGGRKEDQKRYSRLGDIEYDGDAFAEERERVTFLSDTELNTICNIERVEIPSEDPAFTRLNEFEKYARKCMNARGVLKYGDSHTELSEADFPRFKEKIKTRTLTPEENKHIKNWVALFDFYWLHYDKMHTRRMSAEDYEHLVETSIEDLVKQAIDQKKKISKELRKNELDLVYQYAAAGCPSGTRLPECPLRANDLTIRLSDYRMLKKLENLG